MTLNVKIRDKFENDSLAIFVNGEKVYYKSGLNTEMSSSYTDAFNIEARDKTLTLEAVLNSSIRTRKDINPEATAFVEIWFLNDLLEIRTYAEEVPNL